MGVIAMYFFLVMFMTVRIRMVDTIVSCVGTPIMVLDITAPLEVLKHLKFNLMIRYISKYMSKYMDLIFSPFTVGRNS